VTTPEHIPIDEELLRAAVAGSPDGLLIVDDSGRIVFTNHQLVQMVACGRDDLVGRSVEELVPLAVRSRHEQLRAAYTTHPSVRPMGIGATLAARRLDGTEFPVEVSLSPLSTPTGSYVVASVRDISERLEQQERLALTNELLALADERERIARDLHDTVLQHLFALGLELQAIAVRAAPEVGSRLEAMVDSMDQIIRDIRTTVFSLGSRHRTGSLVQQINEAIAQSARVLGFTPRLRLTGPVETVLPDESRPELLASLREALSNVARHAMASEVTVEIVADADVCLVVADNGRGLPDGGASGGNGLHNLAHRAERMGGSCSIANGPSGGAVLTWRVPRLAT
jgi:PAS domain S-box-containing protein